MADLLEAGKIRSIGVSNFNVERMHRAHKALAARGMKLATNQVQYSLLDRGIEYNGLLQASKDLGVSIVAWGPLASGLLSGKFHKDPRVLDGGEIFETYRRYSRVRKFPKPDWAEVN